MAIIQYKDREYVPKREKSLKDLQNYSTATKGLLTALGDYWTEYYRNFEALKWAASGSIAAVSREYDKLLQYVMSSNIVDIPAEQSTYFDLLVFHEYDMTPEYDNDGNLTSYFVEAEDLSNVAYLTTNLFESQIILEKETHFNVVAGKGIRFYVDLFQDPSIVKYAYMMNDGAVRSVLLWGGSIAFSSTLIYERFGRFLYRKATDSEHYKWVVEALMHYYANAKSCTNIQNVMNIIYGVPYTRYVNETVLSIGYTDYYLNDVERGDEAPYIKIVTDKNTYYTYAFSTLNVTVGETVPQYTLVAGFNYVTDYINSPGWWEGIKEPIVLTEGDSRELTKEEENYLMEQVMKYNTVYFKLGVSYETYDTYLAQINEIMNIIRTGFPVYLYPFVQTIFYIVFLETIEANVDFIELLHNLLVDLRFGSQYHFGNSSSYDGSVAYYMEPCVSHGSKYTERTRYYNTTEEYESKGYENTHSPEYDSAVKYDGSKYYDDTCYARDHGSEIEEVVFDIDLDIGDDGYDWDSTPGESQEGEMYSGDRKHDGSVFGPVVTTEGNDSLHIGYLPLLQDAIESILDAFNRMDATVHMDDDLLYLEKFKFSGDTCYDGEEGHDADSCKEDEDSAKVKIVINLGDDENTWSEGGGNEGDPYVGDSTHNGDTFFGDDEGKEADLDGRENRESRYERITASSKFSFSETADAVASSSLLSVGCDFSDLMVEGYSLYDGKYGYVGDTYHYSMAYQDGDLTVFVKIKGQDGSVPVEEAMGAISLLCSLNETPTCSESQFEILANSLNMQETVPEIQTIFTQR